MSTEMLGADEQSVLDLLRILKEEWHALVVLADRLGWDSDRTSDALLNLDESGFIEVAEWENGIHIQLREKCEPLTEQQQAKVVEHLGLAGEVSLRWVVRLQRYDIAEELRHYLQCHLIRVVQKYDPNFHGEGETGFSSYAWQCLQGAARRFLETENHLRGLNYDNKGGVQVSCLSELNEPYYDDPILAWENQEEIKDMLAIVTPIEQDTLLLSHYMEYTRNETATIVGKSWQSVDRIKRNAMDKIRDAYSYDEHSGELARMSDKEPDKLHLRRSKYNVDTRPVLPKHFLGFDAPWNLGLVGRQMHEALGKKVKCQHCSHLDAIGELDYCLYCDRWGQDATATTETENRLRKSVVSLMSKYKQNKANRKTA